MASKDDAPTPTITLENFNMWIFQGRHNHVAQLCRLSAFQVLFELALFFD